MVASCVPGLPSSPSSAAVSALRQAWLFCPCGTAPLWAAGLCRPCYARQAHSRRCFAGHREAVLVRDCHRCQTCGSDRKLAVHHRRPGIHQPRFLVTLCAACHARVHRLSAIRRWLEPALVPLWQEQHPAVPSQLQFDWSRAT